MNDVLAVLLKYGLEPNHITDKPSQHLRGGHGNGLIGKEVLFILLY